MQVSILYYVYIIYTVNFYGLFRGVFSPLIRAMSSDKRSEDYTKQLADKHRKISFCKSVCIKLTTEHCTTCDSRINLNYILN